MALPVNSSIHLIPAYYSFIDPERMKGWVGLVGWPVADGLPTLVVTHQLQVERMTGKVRQSETDALPLCYATTSARDEKGANRDWEFTCQELSLIICVMLSDVKLPYLTWPVRSRILSSRDDAKRLRDGESFSVIVASVRSGWLFNSDRALCAKALETWV